MDKNLNFKISKHIEEEYVGNQVIIIKNVNGVLDVTKTIVLEKLGFEIWNLLKINDMTFNKIINTIFNKYSCKLDIIEKDTLEFINQLKEKEILL